MSKTQSETATLPDLTKGFNDRDTDCITRAFSFAQKAHKGQERSSGEPYFNHVLETTKILSSLSVDAPTISAGLLHDVLEDSDVSEEELEKEFGAEIAFLVKGVTKLGKYKYKGLERHAESLRKFLLATANDVRVLIIRLADRLHNMRTLEHIPKAKWERIALETLEIYAPLAGRLGIDILRGELEDLAFPYIYPKEYETVKKFHTEKRKSLKRRLERVGRTLQVRLHEEGIEPKSVGSRVKNLYSLYKKLKRRDMDIEKVYDVAALRIIVSSVGECYRVLGVVHSLWRPIPSRMKDYIASPKPNGYQSLHTSVFTGDGGRIEVQIRTEWMHREAKFGIAAHLAYKEKDAHKKEKQFQSQTSWIQQFVEWQKTIQESGELLENLKMDFFKDRVFVFTPAGDVIDLPEDSCPIDFAYSIHSDIGNHLEGAKINGKLSSLDTKLKSGDIVEIITKKSSSPSQKWLDYVKTIIARKHIRSALTKAKS